jgi:ubiquinone/menaquinone biosynthesis C-methylase UbiE
MHFDEQAATWDNDPQKIERATVFAEEIKNFLRPDKKLTALEFGSGTGLFSFKLQDAFRTITLVDSSKGMIDVLKEKTEREGIRNFVPLHCDLLREEVGISPVDVIYTLMALHHVPELKRIIQIFHKVLAPGGYLCIADLVRENGSFHADHPDFDGHNGFDRDDLGEVLRQEGFEEVYYKICYEIEKISEGKLVRFPLFLMIVKKL